MTEKGHAVYRKARIGLLGDVLWGVMGLLGMAAGLAFIAWLLIGMDIEGTLMTAGSRAERGFMQIAASILAAIRGVFGIPASGLAEVTTIAVSFAFGCLLMAIVEIRTQDLVISRMRAGLAQLKRAVNAANMLPAQSAVSDLGSLLAGQDSRPPVRRACVDFLGLALPHSRSVVMTFMSKELRREDLPIAARAALRLGEYGNKETMEFLEGLISQAPAVKRRLSRGCKTENGAAITDGEVDRYVKVLRKAIVVSKKHPHQEQAAGPA